MMSAILPCKKRRERIRGGPLAIRGARLVPVSPGLYAVENEGVTAGDFGNGEYKGIVSSCCFAFKNTSFNDLPEEIIDF